MYTQTAYADISLMEDYPFHGVFYKLKETVSEDGDYELEDDDDTLADDGDYGLDDDDETAASSETAADESTEETEASTGTETETDDSSDETDSSETVILETPCDIQQNTALFAGTSITRGYKVYFPFNPDIADLPAELKPGILFRGEMYGLTVAGTVLDPVASMTGGCMVEIRGTDI